MKANAMSRVFGFEDEVAIRVTEAEGATPIDMRSRSRLRKNDRGADVRRIRSFLVDLDIRARQ